MPSPHNSVNNQESSRSDTTINTRVQVNGSDLRQPCDLTLAESTCQLVFRLARSEYLFALGASDLLEVDAAQF